ILRGETPQAIDLLHQQSEAGKDMMRLMSDLIAYLRDLLVFKAKPDALNDDVDPDVQKTLAAHAELISTDRLLEVIDKLGELRDGGGGPPRKSAAVSADVSPAPRTRAAGTLATSEARVEEKS